MSSYYTYARTFITVDCLGLCPRKHSVSGDGIYFFLFSYESHNVQCVTRPFGHVEYH